MPSPEAVFEAIEADRAQREYEVRLIENIIQLSKGERERESLRRSLTMLTYAHLEGFCKFSLLAYKSAVNAANVACSDATTPIVAATLSSLLAALRDVNMKDPAFKKNLPDDKDLHLLWRERTFIEGFRDVISRPVTIPDRVVDTKSNLNSAVLKRNLYLLGLPHPEFDQHEATINELLGRRNAIAHGDSGTVPAEADLKRYVTSSFKVMQFLQSEIYEALRSEAYLRKAA
jgi:hypothetical protein